MNSYTRESVCHPVSENPGEAVLTNGSGSLAVVNEIKMNREQVRAENEAVLMEIINNVNLSEGEIHYNQLMYVLQTKFYIF